MIIIIISYYFQLIMTQKNRFGLLWEQVFINSKATNVITLRGMLLQGCYSISLSSFKDLYCYKQKRPLCQKEKWLNWRLPRGNQESFCYVVFFFQAYLLVTNVPCILIISLQRG